MKKLRLILTGVAGALLIAGCSSAAQPVEKMPERNKRIIVEVGYDINDLTADGVKNSQNYVYNNIKAFATTNVKKLNSYDTLVNAFVVEVNENDIEKIKQVPGVKSVTIDKIHAEQVYSNDGAEPLYIPYNAPGDPGEPEENISATTMNKPAVTNDGEGTLIAILDNEFHFRGAHDGKEEWHHEVYGALDPSVKVRYTFDQIKAVKGLNAKRVSTAGAGEEGSLYFNNKVPFYYDYGGWTKNYGKPDNPGPDVHSEKTYHGSHVSSIAAGNSNSTTDPQFKGIAPKAQLACMKVFTEYHSKEGIGDAIGLSDSSGAYDSVILSALEDCIKLKVDGINMSLGSDLDDFDSNSITLKTLTKLHENGILSAISAGNSGKASYSFTGAYGNWGTEMVETGIMSSYANNAASMTIASGQPTKIFYENAFHIGTENVAFEDQIVNRDGYDDDYSEEYRMSDLTNPNPDWVYVPGFGTSSDYNGLDVSGKVAVVNRGSTAFADKYAVARSQGAIALVIINNDPTASSFNFRCSFGDGFNPTMPCALVLFKDKQLFESIRSGKYTLIKDDISDNSLAYTMSSFSTDGATFDLDLKPEITAPGDNIKGAVPEFALTNKTKEEREELKNKAYQYLSGTSMSAPNYAGAQSVVLSKVAADDSKTANQIADFRKTVDMRLMSTADPMSDATNNPETDEPTKTSVRLQGAGMVDIGGALNTDVYLEGLDANGDGVGKAKISLRNNADIAKGDIKLSFLAHNESEATRNYNVRVSVMRPAIAHPNNLVTKDYNYMGEIDSIESLPGSVFYDTSLERMSIASGSHAYKDAYKVSKDVEYWISAEQYEIYQYWIDEGNPEKAKEYVCTLKQGYYFNASESETEVDWREMPSYTAQSVQDVEIAYFEQTLQIPAGDNIINLNSYSLSEDLKNEILATYEFGCMIEGFVEMDCTDTDANAEDLSIPYLGFYSATDKNPDNSYSTAPAVEPFNFEKDITKVYPSDYVNDIAKSLIGKDKVNFESMMVAGYAPNPGSIDTDKILTNDLAFDGLTGFYKLGTDPATGEYLENPADNLYLGSKNTNTLIIQQFVLRSVADNYFTITNKETGAVVYKSALSDMLFGDTAGKWALYKSHVDAGYLSAGYVAHRAYAIVPLYDAVSGEAFPSGEYEIKFNYNLIATGAWVSNSYTLHIDSDIPEVTNIKQYSKDGVERVRFEIKENRVAYGVIGLNRVEAHYDSEKGVYYFDEEKSFVDSCINEVSSNGGRRLFVRAVDYARGSVGCLIHFDNYNDFNKGATTVQGENITVAMDFELDSKTGLLKFVDNNGNELSVEGNILLNNELYDPLNPKQPGKKSSTNWTMIIIIIVASVVGLALLTFGALIIVGFAVGGSAFAIFTGKRKKKKVAEGGNE